MAKRGQSKEEILRVLRKEESGETAVEVCGKHGIGQQNFLLLEEEIRHAGPKRVA